MTRIEAKKLLKKYNLQNNILLLKKVQKMNLQEINYLIDKKNQATVNPSSYWEIMEQKEEDNENCTIPFVITTKEEYNEKTQIQYRGDKKAGQNEVPNPNIVFVKSNKKTVNKYSKTKLEAVTELPKNKREKLFIRLAKLEAQKLEAQKLQNLGKKARRRAEVLQILVKDYIIDSSLFND